MPESQEPTQERLLGSFTQKEFMARKMLSPSSINLYMECERCFWLKMNKGVKRPSGPFPSLPSGMDGIIKEHFDRYREHGEQPPELDAEGVDAVPFDDTAFLEMCRDWRSDPSYTHTSGYVLRGGVDDLLQEPGGELVVLDYKTRGYPPKEEVPDYYARQVNLYNLILDKNGYKTADYGLLLYYYPDRILASGEIIFHNEVHRVPVDLSASQRLLTDAIRVVQGEKPDHSPECDFCDWNTAEH